MQKMEQDKVVGETKERKYLLNYSIPGKYEVLFPPDGSDDDNDDDSDEGEDSDEAGDEENEGRKEERKNEETKGKRSPRPLSGGNNRKVFIAPKSVTVSAKN
jgi:nitric oxide reductase activation protein